jgi:hypothetical protein
MRGVTWSAVLFALASAAALGSCSRTLPPARPPEPPPNRLTLDCHGPRQALLGVGDRLPFALGVLRGQRGEWTCGVADPTAVRWTSSDSTVAVISASGEVSGRSPGRATIRAELDAQATEREVRVLPAVGSLVWMPPETTVVVGDTVRLHAIAQDSAGVALERLLPLALGPLDEQAGEIAAFDPAGGVVVRGIRPGRLLLVAELAHRKDTAVVVVRPAAP